MVARVTHSQLEQYAKYVLENDSLPIVLERMSLRYWNTFRKGSDTEKEAAKLKQDMMDDFYNELQAILNEATEDITH